MSKRRKPKKMRAIPYDAMNAWERAEVIEGMNSDRYRITPQHQIVYKRSYGRAAARGGWALNRRNGEIIAYSTIHARRSRRRTTT